MAGIIPAVAGQGIVLSFLPGQTGGNELPANHTGVT
jgi:hypothetical protein